MARLGTWGFEHGRFTANVDINGANSGTGLVFGAVTSPVRSGGYAAKTATTTTSGAVGATLNPTLASQASGATRYYRVWVYLDTFPDSTVGIIQVTSGFQVRCSATGVLTLTTTAGVQIGSNSASVSTGQWFSVEVDFTFQSAANETVSWRVNGTTVEAGISAAVTTVGPTNLTIGWIAAPGTSKAAYFDDIAVNDDSGAAENIAPSRLAKVVAQKTVTVSNRGSWTGGAGGTTLANMVTALSTRPLAGTDTETDTTQIESALSTTNTIIVVTETFTSAGIAAADTITLICAEAVHGEDIATGTKTGTLRANGNPVDSGTVSFNYGNDAGALLAITDGGAATSNEWFRTLGNIVYAPTPTLGTGVTLELADTTADTRVTSCCWLAALVEYVPGVAAVSPPPTRRSPVYLRR